MPEIALDNTVITFSGGEPLLRNDIFDIASHAQKRKFKTMLLTNGSMVYTSHIAQKVVNSFDRIQITIDGITQNAFEKCRGLGTYNPTMLGLQNLLETGKRIEIAFMALPENINDLSENLILWCDRLKWKKYSFDIRITTRLFQEGRAKTLCNSYYSKCKEIESRIQDLLLSLSREGFHCDINNIGQVRMENCGIGHGFFVDADGHVYPCAEPYYSIGSFPENTIYEIFDRVRKISQSCSVSGIEVCKKCYLRLVCGGGCKIQNHKRNNSFSIVDCDEKHKKGIIADMIYNRKNQITRRLQWTRKKPRATEAQPSS